MKLSCSRDQFVRPVIRMDQALEPGHGRGVRVLRWCPLRLIPDNLMTGVDRPDLYDPRLNRSFGELAAHFDILVDPARRPSRGWSGRCRTSGTRSGGRE